MPNLREIEADLAADREVLRQQMSALEAQFAPSEIVGKASDLLSYAGRGLGKGAVSVARQNPGPLAVTGTGLAWMAVSAVLRSSRPRAVYDDTPRPTASGLRTPEPQMAGFDARVAAADTAMKSNSDTIPQQGAYSMTDVTHSDTRLGHAKERLYDSADSLRARIEDGLDGLPDGAKARIRQARETAISVQARAEAEAARAAQAVRTTAHDNPLLVGALALAAGAAIAAMLPRTQVEDKTVGAHRDRLFDEADRIFREEKAKLTAAAENAVADGQARVREALESDDDIPLPDAVLENASKPASRSVNSAN